MNSIIKDAALAPQGRQKIEWARKHMPVLNGIAEDVKRNQALKGIKVALSVHMEAKTAYLAQVLAECGAELYATGSNPLSTQDDVAAALADHQDRGAVLLLQLLGVGIEAEAASLSLPEDGLPGSFADMRLIVQNPGNGAHGITGLGGKILDGHC